MAKVQNDSNEFQIELNKYLTVRQEELLNPSLTIELFNVERNEFAKSSLAKKVIKSLSNLGRRIF